MDVPNLIALHWLMDLKWSSTDITVCSKNDKDSLIVWILHHTINTSITFRIKTRVRIFYFRYFLHFPDVVIIRIGMVVTFYFLCNVGIRKLKISIERIPTSIFSLQPHFDNFRTEISVWIFQK